ncbi:MAG: family 20 glycosylhydrolase [Flavobacteriaceae bacterium]|nr:family 20 glycosylhydrolase [Flavobacteriaceae bacterium]
MKKYFLLFSIFIALTACDKKQKAVTMEDLSIIPQPNEIQLEKGFFTFNEKTVFVIPNAKWNDATSVLTDRFQKVCGWNLKTKKEGKTSNIVVFSEDKSLPNEAYLLDVKPSKIEVKASSYNGFLYAMETIRQLLPNEIESTTKVADFKASIPALTIKDSPRFKWRGLMLDVSRHFFKKEYILKTIDRLAFLKMNVLQMHLMDDQGWRIEIKKYPKLTEVGAWRVDQEDKHWNARDKNKPSDKATYGGFYTQEDIKEIVAYAQKKGVTVVPEVEMPAHIMCAISAYPELSCQNKQIAVPSGGVWPITDIYCAGNEKTFTFLEDILNEVMALFPSKYIHIGGDEATKTNWKKCPKCKRRMRKEKLKNVEELQSYFVKRMEKFINSKGRKLIGWDEILEGGLAPQATVMSWRGVKGGLEASEQGHDVIMTPGTHCYFDHYQGTSETEPLAIGGYTTLSKVYQFDPVVDKMSEEQAKHVLGGQANLWAEYIPTEEHSEYMLFPRLVALSETLWSKKDQRNWADFSRKIQKMFLRLKAMNINYAESSKNVTFDTKIDDKNTIHIVIKSEFPNADIRYSINGKEPVKYTKPIEINETTTLKASLFENEKPIGKPAEKTFHFHKGVGKKVSYKIPADKRYFGNEKTLVNILKGSHNFHDGKWQGWNAKSPEIVVDLGKTTDIKNIKVGCLEEQGSWIFMPEKVTFWVSEDGKKYTPVGEEIHPFKRRGEKTLKNFTVAFKKQKARFVKVKVSYAKHHLNGVDSWVFIDEIIIE